MVGWRLGAVHEDVGLEVNRRSFGWKRSVFKTHAGAPYKVYNSVPVVLVTVLYLKLGMGLGFLTKSNKPFIRFGVTGPILKSTTEVNTEY